MSLFEILQNNKGTISSALGKELAGEVLAGNMDILTQCIGYSTYNIDIKGDKGIRASAAKTIEKVAEKNPQLVAGYLDELLPAFGVDEPQTRWMMMQIFRYCAHLSPETAAKAIPYAREYIDQKDKHGVCLAGAVDLYLGEYGGLSSLNTQLVYPLIMRSISSCIRNEHDWIIEALIQLAPYLDDNQKQSILPFALSCHDVAKQATDKRIKKLGKALDLQI